MADLSGLAPDEAQDCAQEAFVQAFTRRGQLRDAQAFPLWFHRTSSRATSWTRWAPCARAKKCRWKALLS